MRRLALLACCLSCTEWRRAPTFPEQAAERPVVHEQALLGVSESGVGAVAELLDAEGEPPRLRLLSWEEPGRSPRTLREAAADRAIAVAERIRREGARAEPLLAGALAAGWPEATAAAREAGFPPQPAAAPDPGPLWRIRGAPEAGALPLVLGVAREDDALVVRLGDGAPDAAQVEVARMPLAGEPIEPRLFVSAAAAWLLAGSVLPGRPLRRAIGLRRISLRRAEARLHREHALADARTGEMDAARRELQRASGADPAYFDALYDAAAVAALTGREEEAIAWLRRAASIDGARVQVLGRDDADLRSIRRRPEVRELLGLRRLPPEGVPPP